MVKVGKQPSSPIYLMEMIIRLSDSCKRELRKTKIDMSVPRCKPASGPKCFSHKGAKLWNDISFEIRHSKTYEIFKNHICNVNKNS